MGGWGEGDRAITATIHAPSRLTKCLPGMVAGRQARQIRKDGVLGLGQGLRATGAGMASAWGREKKPLPLSLSLSLLLYALGRHQAWGRNLIISPLYKNIIKMGGKGAA